MQWSDYTPELPEPQSSGGSNTLLVGNDLLSMYQCYNSCASSTVTANSYEEDKQASHAEGDVDSLESDEEDEEAEDDGGAMVHLDELVKESYRRYAQISTVLDLVTDSIGELQNLEERHRSINESTQRLHDKCDTLMREYAKLTSTAQRIAKPLFHFDVLGPLTLALTPTGSATQYYGNIMPLEEIRRIQQSFRKRMEMDKEDKLIQSSPEEVESNSASSYAIVKESVMTHEELMSLGDRIVKEDEVLFAKSLTQIDQAVAFLQKHTQYRDASVFLERYLTLRAMTLERCRNTCIQKIQQCVRQVQDNANKLHLRHGAHLPEEKPTLMDARVSSIMYVRFRNACQELMPPLLQLHLRCQDTSTESYSKLLSVHSYFMEQRVAVLQPFVLAHLRNSIREHKKHIRSLGSTIAAAEEKNCRFLLQILRKVFMALGTDPKKLPFYASRCLR
eukprot:gb/GECG01013762.1/.p1 GENE.gb/GECG01013762.1/~~gb/GECG01013762.1/.p1  ORF type:complete len:448 (+),score=60.15 gb/GECG01013762.1/:1-1344(+)